MQLAAADPLPSSYNLNTYGWLTPVKNQGYLGTCWAFANTTAFESSLLKLGLVSSPTAPEIQLSEWHLATANGNITDLTPNEDGEYDGWGGFNEFAIGYWTRGRGQWEMLPTAGTLPAGGGPVLESANPLNQYPLLPARRGENLEPYVSPASQVQAPYMLSQSVRYEWSGELADLGAFQASLKDALQKYGALSVYVRADDDPADPKNPVWFTDDGVLRENHAVTLVGWDDTIHLTYDGKDYYGGWYIQNSWGVNTGYTDAITNEGGYYWVPFEDASIANVKQATALVTRTDVYAPTGHKFAPTVVQNQIFGPFNGQIERGYVRRGFDIGTDTMVATKERIASNSAVAAIGLWQGDAGTVLKSIRIYDDWGATGPTGNLLYEKNNVALNADGSGYNMLDLDAPIFLAEGKPLYFLVDFGDGYNAPVMVDTRTVTELTAEYGTYAGLSWISSNGADWTDLFSADPFSLDPAIFFFKAFRLNLDLDNNNAQFAIDPNYDFTVDGFVKTSVDGSANTILGLNFEDGGVLALNGDLTVTDGYFNVADDYATGIIGVAHKVFTPGDFTKLGEGKLMLLSEVQVGGDAFVNDGILEVDNLFTVAGALNVTQAGLSIGAPGRLVAGSWSLAGGETEIEGEVQIADLVSMSGGELTLFEGSSLTANRWTMAEGEVALGGSVAVGAFTQGGGLFTVQRGGSFAADNLAVEGGAFDISSGGLADIAGSAAVQNGLLNVNGQLNAQTVFVNGGGVLGGAGQIFANVVNGGVVSPGNSPGTLTINGDFTQTASGTLNIEVAGPQDYDVLVVNGAARLGGALVVSPYGGYALQLGDKIDFLQAWSISGGFDSIVLPTNLRGRLLLDDGTATVLVAPQSYTLVAVTQNQKNVAAALDAYIPATSGDRLAVSTALDSLTAQEYPAAFNAISPAYYESLASIGIEQAFSQGQIMQQRFRAVQLGARGFSQSGFVAPALKDKDGKATVGKDILAPTEDNKWGVWVQGNGSFAHTASVNDVPKYSFNSGGFLGGADYRWTDSFATGLYAGYQGTYAKYSSGGNTIINSTRFGGYATYGQAAGFFANTMIGGGYSGYQVSRPIEFGDIDRTARSRPDGGDFETLLNLGYNWQLGDFNVGVVASGQYTYLGLAPFTESGAESLDLAVDQQNANSLRTLLGGQIAYSWKIAPAVTLIPQASLYWQHEFLQYPRNIGASLDGGNGPSFDYSTASPARDSVYAGVGLSANFGSNWSANFYYNANFGRQDFVNNTVTLGFDFSF